MKLDNSTIGVRVKKKSVISEVPGVRVKKGGVITTVWVKGSGEEFYWIKDGTVQSGYPSSYENYTVSPTGLASYLYSNTLTECWLQGASSSNSGFTGETVAVSTKGNKYMEVTMNDTGVSGDSESGVINNFLVAGVECKDQVAPSAVIKVDVSAMSTVTLKLIMTAWQGGNNMAHKIKSIRFYN